MKRLFTGKVRLMLVIAVLLAIILAVVTNITGKSLPDLMVQSVLTPIREGVSKLTDQAERLYSYMFEYETLLAENEQLKDRISQMQDDARVADSLARENARLRALLDLLDDHEDYNVVDAYIISWSSNDWSSTFTINRGANAGIQVNMCAITENGDVVGLVTEVGSNYAVVKSVLDSTLQISATIATSGYNGIVQGGYSSGQKGYLRMDYLPSSAVIRNNDQVVTSGSTMYPRDLILGHVIDAGFDDSGVAKFALLQPAAKIDTLEQVFILTDYNKG